MNVILETSRLILREFVPADADALARVLCDPVTMQYFPMQFDRAAVEEWIARNRHRYETHGHGLWAMELKSSGEMIGDCGITQQDVDGQSMREIGYHLRRDLWGQGLATEGARACRYHGFMSLQAAFLISLIRPENEPSRRVAERCGMTVWKQTVRVGLPHLVYRVMRDEWDAAKSASPLASPD